MKSETERHTHVVFYKTNPLNPKAKAKIIEEAKNFLSGIPGIDFFHAAAVLDLGRAVGAGKEYAVMLVISFSSTWAYESYMAHPDHLKFVKFVLRGYVLANSHARDPAVEFIRHILSGEKPRAWVRNKMISDEEVVWGGELVFDAAD